MANFKNFHQVNFSYCADKSNNNPTAPHHPHLPSCISNTLLTLLTCTTTFSQPPHVENYAAAATANLNGQSWTDQAAQNAQAPIQGSNALGLAVTALSCANKFNVGGALGGDGSIAALSVVHPPLMTMTTFLQHQHTVTHAVPTSLIAVATCPMSTTSVAMTVRLIAVAMTTRSTAVAVTTCSTAMAATMHSTAAAAGLKHPYDPGGNYPNNENDDDYFMYDPGGDHLDNTSNSSCANITHNTTACSLISTAHNDTLIPHYKLVHTHFVFNAMLLSSTDNHPFLPLPNLQCTDATQQPSIQDVMTTTATSKQSEEAVEMAMVMGTVC